MSQSHFTLCFPLKSAADAKAITEQLPALMPDFLQSPGFARDDSLLAFHPAERQDSAVSGGLRR